MVHTQVPQSVQRGIDDSWWGSCGACFTDPLDAER